MEDQTPQENAQVFENIDFNSSPEDAKEQSIAAEQEQVLVHINLQPTKSSRSWYRDQQCYAQCIGVNALLNL